MAQIPRLDGLPGWMAPADVVNHQDTPALWRKELAARRELMANEATRLGAELAAEPPAWAAALGPVPSDPARQEQWRQLAMEISTYRDTYRVPEPETSPVPAQHQENGTGAELTARITAMHKYSAQTAKEPLAPADAAHMAEAAQVEALVKDTPTPAEQVVDHLQETRGAEAQLSPAQERAERIAAPMPPLRRPARLTVPVPIRCRRLDLGRSPGPVDFAERLGRRRCASSVRCCRSGTRRGYHSGSRRPGARRS